MIAIRVTCYVVRGACYRAGEGYIPCPLTVDQRGSQTGGSHHELYVFCLAENLS